jgi:hypothetical protein
MKWNFMKEDEGHGERPMKALLAILGMLWFSIFSLVPKSFAREGISEEYVYLLKSEGGKAYRVMEKAAGDPKGKARKEIRRMELFPPGTILEIEKGATVVLTCGGCRVLTVTPQDSPFVVKMEDFKKEGSTAGKILESFTLALNHYIHPNSMPGSKVYLKTRGGPVRLCKDLWPPDHAEIMLIDPITFKWGSKGAPVTLEIKEFGKSTVYSKKASSMAVDVPVGIFEPGRRYEWFLVEEGTGQKCSASFRLLSKDESDRIVEIINHLPILLPPETDLETRCRLQAGYLVYEGLDYDARRWLEGNGISE